MTVETILTQEGYRKLADELEYLKTTKRTEVADKIRVARGFGDLSENAEYDAAKDEQAQIEARIYTIEEQLKFSKIIEEPANPNQSTVTIGSTVRILDVEFNEEMQFTIVGTVESNPKKNRISNESPLGQKLVGAKVGDTLNVESPNGFVAYKVLEIIR